MKVNILELFPKVDLAIILGSGVSFDLPSIRKDIILYKDIPNLPQTKVSGHRGHLCYYELENKKKVLVFSGRFHLYEGKSVEEVQSLINLIHSLDIQNILLTNAAGGIREDLEVGDLVLINEIKDFQNDGDLADKQGLLNCIDKSVIKINTKLTHFLKSINNIKTGSYVSVLGPNYETLAEINLFNKMNIAAVGMSTYLEAKKALELDKNIAVVSVITNTWFSNTEPSHEEVLENSQNTQSKMNKLFANLVKFN